MESINYTFNLQHSSVCLSDSAYSLDSSADHPPSKSTHRNQTLVSALPLPQIVPHSSSAEFTTRQEDSLCLSDSEYSLDNSHINLTTKYASNSKAYPNPLTSSRIGLHEASINSKVSISSHQGSVFLSDSHYSLDRNDATQLANASYKRNTSVNPTLQSNTTATTTHSQVSKQSRTQTKEHPTHIGATNSTMCDFETSPDTNQYINDMDVAILTSCCPSCSNHLDSTNLGERPMPVGAEDAYGTAMGERPQPIGAESTPASSQHEMLPIPENQELEIPKPKAEQPASNVKSIHPLGNRSHSSFWRKGLNNGMKCVKKHFRKVKSI